MKHCISILSAAALLVLAAGCSKIDGTVSGNQPPTVSFVNNQQDADSARQVYTIPDYTFIFPDSTQGFGEAVGGQLPDAIGVEAKFELIRYQFFFVESIVSITEVNPEDGTTVTVPADNYRLDADVRRYLWIQHTAGFQWKLGYNYVINGTFEYLPVYSYAPMIFWRGADPDGFVEGYRYLDYPYEDEAQLAAFIQRVESNDPVLADTTQAIHWIETLNTQAVINLTTALGRIQKHVVFLQAIDNDGEYSAAARRVFNRSNRAPNTPVMAYYKDGYTRVSQPGEYERHIIGWEDIETEGNFITRLKSEVSAYYEIPMATEPLENWNGVRFLVSGDDPDDQALVTIPLQFQFLLNRIPAALVAEYMADDAIDGDGTAALTDSTRVTLSEDNTADFDLHNFDADFWSEHNQIELFNLPTGFYQLTIYSRDDGFESCAEPAWMRFKVQQMSMEKDVLVIDYTPLAGATAMASLGYASDDEYMAFYRALVEGAMPDVKRLAPLEPVSNYQVVWKDQVAEGEDYNCRYWKIGAETLPSGYPIQLPLSVISQYHTVICLDDKWAQGAGGGSGAGDWIRNPAKGFLMDYLDMGGSVFWTGMSSLVGTFNYSPTDNATTIEANVNAKAGDFLAQYMGILGVYGDINTTFFNSRIDACVAGLPEFEGQSPLLPDTTRIWNLRGRIAPFGAYNSFYTPSPTRPYQPVAPDTGMVFIESYALNENLGTVAAYTYGSFTAGMPARRVFEIFRVAQQSDLPENFYTTDSRGDGPYFPAYSTNPDATGCWLYIPQAARYYWDMQVTDAIDSWNVSRPDSTWADPFLVTYGVQNSNVKVFIRVNHQRINDPAQYWAAGDTVNVDLVWQPILRKHRKPLLLYTENQAYQGNFGGFNFSPYYTNFRTAFNGMPLHLILPGEWPDYLQNNAGSGARSVMSGVLFQFYTPKLQELD
jgi:hypothetical protein